MFIYDQTGMTRVVTLLFFYLAVLDLKFKEDYDIEEISNRIMKDNKLACPNIRIVK